MRQGLLLHCGARGVDRGAVLAVPTPRETESFFPIPHGDLLLHVERELADRGLEVVDHACALAHDGAEFFGLLEVARPDGGAWANVIGVRNSHNHRFAASVAIGARVFVCNNLSFGGDVVIGRKHTRFIARDLDSLIPRAIGRLDSARIGQERRFSAYQSTPIQSDEAYALIVKLLKSRAIGPRRVRDVVREWDSPSHEEFRDPTVWRLYNAVTDALKPRGNVQGGVGGLYQNQRASDALHGVLDGVCGLN